MTITDASERTTAHSSSAGGANLSRVRAHNERLVLSLLRASPSSRAEIARRSGLSAQTISLIVRALETDGLVQSGDPVKGRVGQPSVPLTLDPAGAWFAGLQIGRRRAELVLIDFAGQVAGACEIAYRWPDPDVVARFVEAEWPALKRGVPRARLHGLGIAMPSDPWQWPERLGVPPALEQRWRESDLAAEIGALIGLPVHVENDATAACGAELTFGEGRAFRDFAYFFVGHFIGGGIVLDATVHGGRHGNAAAFGSLPVPDPEHPGALMQLIDAASLHVLESMIAHREAGHRGASGASPVPTITLRGARSALWTRRADVVVEWEQRASVALATAIVSIASVTEIEAVIVDGIFPAAVRRSLCERTERALSGVDTRGIAVPPVLPGSIGARARALGAARLPLFARFLLDRGVLTRLAV